MINGQISLRSEPQEEALPNLPDRVFPVHGFYMRALRLMDGSPEDQMPKVSKKSPSKLAKFCSSKSRTLRKKASPTRKEHIESPEKYTFTTKKFPSTC